MKNNQLVFRPSKNAKKNVAGGGGGNGKEKRVELTPVMGSVERARIAQHSQEDATFVVDWVRTGDK